MIRQVVVGPSRGHLPSWIASIKPQRLYQATVEPFPHDRRRVREAWKTEVYDTYSTTEYVVIGADCEYRRMHLLEDGAVIEIDKDRILLTVLRRRTQPLIRYEISDAVRSLGGQCKCGRPFRMIQAVDGRAEDVLTIGTVQVQPKQFHDLLEPMAPAGWQVIQEGDLLRVLLIGGADDRALQAITVSVRNLLERLGALTAEILVINADGPERGSTGKAPLVVSRTARRQTT